MKIVVELRNSISPETVVIGNGSMNNYAEIVEKSEECTPVKHIDEFHTQYGLTSFYDLEEGHRVIVSCVEN